MRVYTVMYNDGSGEGDYPCGVFDSPEAAEYYISKQSANWYYSWYSEEVRTLEDLTRD
jgi:hypothetical protein